MPRGGTTGLPPTPAELRALAARARHHASYLSGGEAEKRLLELAEELEAKAVALETPQAVIPRATRP
jgi:hypothetical protein